MTKIYLRKLSEHSVATAFATNVFPVPGGPYNRIPRNGINLYVHIPRKMAKFCQPEENPVYKAKKKSLVFFT